MKLLAGRVRALHSSRMASCFTPEKRFKNIVDFLTFLSRLFKLGRESEINKVNDKAIKLNEKIDNFAR